MLWPEEFHIWPFSNSDLSEHHLATPSRSQCHSRRSTPSSGRSLRSRGWGRRTSSRGATRSSRPRPSGDRNSTTMATPSSETLLPGSAWPNNRPPCTLEPVKSTAYAALTIKSRAEARTNKDWEKSDSIRSKLNELGINVRDESNGQIWVRI